MKYGLCFKIRFYWRNGFWPLEQHIRACQWLETKNDSKEQDV